MENRKTKILIILAHPNKSSFNHAIAEVCLNVLKPRNEIIYHDLYEENFDPVLPSEEIPKYGGITDPTIKDYCNELTSADGMIVIHPNWWGQPPAILKGWVDRVFRPGVAYEFKEGDKGEGIPRGLLKVKKAVVFNTSNTAPERENNFFGDPLETIWKNCIFGLCGVSAENFYRRTFSVVITSSQSDRIKWLEEVKKTVENVFSEK